MDWIHCNGCYAQPGQRGQEQRRFLLTSCGHVFCAQCCMACANDKCKVCQSNCKMIPLSSKMKPDVEIFFTNPMELARRCLASFRQAEQKMQTVSDFQHGHRQRLMEHMRSEVRSLQQNARSRSQLEASYQQLEQRCQQLEHRCQQLEQQLAAAQARRSPRNSPGFFSGMVCSRPISRDSPQAASAPSISPYMDVVRRSRPFELAAAGGGDTRPMVTSPQQTGRRQSSLLAKLFASPGGVPRSPNNI